MGVIFHCKRYFSDSLPFGRLFFCILITDFLPDREFSFAAGGNILFGGRQQHSLRQQAATFSSATGGNILFGGRRKHSLRQQAVSVQRGTVFCREEAFATYLGTFWHLHTPSKLFSGTPSLLPTVPAIRCPHTPLSQHTQGRDTVADSTKLLNCPRLPPPERCSNGGTVADVLQELQKTVGSAEPAGNSRIATACPRKTITSADDAPECLSSTAGR